MNELKNATQTKIITKTDDATELLEALQRLPSAERKAVADVIKGVEIAIETAANRAS